MSKNAVVVFSDPRSGSDEALGRLFNALFMTYELKEKGHDVALIFQGAGVRWASEIVKPDHPANALYKTVEDSVVGACGGCADVFAADGELEDSEIPLVRETEIPGTSGVIDLSRYLENGYKLITF